MKKHIVIFLSIFIYKVTFCNIAEEIFKSIFGTIDKFINFPIAIFNKLVTETRFVLDLDNSNIFVTITSIALMFGILALSFEVMNKLHGNFRWRDILFRMALTFFCIFNTGIIVMFSNALYFKIASALFPATKTEASIFDVLKLVENIFNTPGNVLGKGFQLTFLLFFSVGIGLILFFVCSSMVIILIQKQLLEIFLPIYASGVGCKDTEHYIIDGAVKYTSYNIAILTVLIHLFLLTSIFKSNFVSDMVQFAFNLDSSSDNFESTVTIIKNVFGIIFLILIGLFTLGFKALSGKFEAIMHKKINNRRESLAEIKEEKKHLKNERKREKKIKKFQAKTSKKGRETKELKQNLLKILSKLKIRNLVGYKEGNRLTKKDFLSVLNNLKNLKDIKKEEKTIKNYLNKINKELNKEEKKANKGLKKSKEKGKGLEKERNKLTSKIERNIKILERLDRLQLGTNNPALITSNLKQLSKDAINRESLLLGSKLKQTNNRLNIHNSNIKRIQVDNKLNVLNAYLSKGKIGNIVPMNFKKNREIKILRLEYDAFKLGKRIDNLNNFKDKLEKLKDSGVPENKLRKLENRIKKTEVRIKKLEDKLEMILTKIEILKNKNNSKDKSNNSTEDQSDSSKDNSNNSEDNLKEAKSKLKEEMDKPNPDQNIIMKLQTRISENMNRDSDNAPINKEKLRNQIKKDKNTLNTINTKIQINRREEIQYLKESKQISEELKLLTTYTAEITKTISFSNSVLGSNNLLINNTSENYTTTFNADNMFDNNLIDDDNIL